MKMDIKRQALFDTANEQHIDIEQIDINGTKGFQINGKWGFKARSIREAEIYLLGYSSGQYDAIYKKKG